MAHGTPAWCRPYNIRITRRAENDLFQAKIDAGSWSSLTPMQRIVLWLKVGREKLGTIVMGSSSAKNSSCNTEAHCLSICQKAHVGMQASRLDSRRVVKSRWLGAFRRVSLIMAWIFAYCRIDDMYHLWNAVSGKGLSLAPSGVVNVLCAIAAGARVTFTDDA